MAVQRPATHLNPVYRFESFVAGPGNQLPLAAARAVVASESRGYNPLFIHGGVGLGKTHLLQAMAQAFAAEGGSRRVLYVPCEHFVNHFITSVERQGLDAFRRTYRETDVLIMDDVHLLAGKERSQEEFLHTFNLLYNSSRQVVLSADAEPGGIPFLTERLTSRFRWGLVCELGSPDLDTRIALVRARAQRLETPLPEEVVRFLAEHVRSNVRELEGAVVRVAGHAALTAVEPSLALAQEVLKDVVRSNRKRVSLDHITGVVTERFGVKLADLQGKRRIQAIVLPRQICMYLARRLTGLSLEAVGGYFGGRDHSTVLYGVDRMGDRMQRDESFRDLVEDLTREVVKRVEP